MLDSTTIERDLAFAIEAARVAGERGLALRAEDRWEGKMLGDVCDQACDGYLHGFLTGRYPDDGILSEETTDTPERLDKSRVWIVDPLDGTKEYAQLRDDWGVHVALAVDGRCALGAVALPSQGKIYYGVCQDGAHHSGVVCTGEHRIVTGTSASPAKPRIAVSRSHTPEWVDRFASAMDGELAPAGSAGNKVAMLLAGDADMYVHKIGLKEWDTCAPETIARSAGWHVCRLDGTEHTYNRRDPKNHELVVCRPAVKEQVLAALKASGALEDRLVK
ncbi:3'-phosphoadenosine 5'-phosphate phosphatase [Planctomycetes bacterium Poly30]|uniref:3'-phosphoadenosine 5'-phosphate phosphatase n=1 Tax=Saltatorellus ferox TaxID=2528018 RepID=A0A518EZ42_9BACT|nr:3'-phosphoadenosine 5'-phosphate phosphatase [Planctomycetes bacterium Poly30]